MKKVAVLIYPQFCNFEISVALEMLRMANKPITIFAKSKQPIKSEEGLTVLCDLTIDKLNIEEYDALLLAGCMDLRETIEDESIINFIKKFNREDQIIGAISSAPLLLLKCGMLDQKKYLAGVNKEWLLEEGFKREDLKGMVDVPMLLANPVTEGYIKDGNIITSVAWYFREWSMEFGRMIGIEVYPKSFGLEK